MTGLVGIGIALEGSKGTAMQHSKCVQMRPNAIKCSMLRMHHVTNAPR